MVTSYFLFLVLLWTAYKFEDHFVSIVLFTAPPPGCAVVRFDTGHAHPLQRPRKGYT